MLKPVHVISFLSNQFRAKLERLDRTVIGRNGCTSSHISKDHDVRESLGCDVGRYCPTKTNCVLVEFDVFGHCPTRHGDVVFQVISSFVAQSVDLSVWQDVQGLEILYLSVIDGEMNLKVCELTNAPGTPWVSIFGMWQATH